MKSTIDRAGRGDYRHCVISAHRTCIKNALAKYFLSEDQQGILQAVSARIGLTGEPIPG